MMTCKTKSGKTLRDPNAPKRNLSAYLLYQNAMREQFKADNPGMSFGQLSKYTSHMYKALTPAERDEWLARAEQDKARYEMEMRNYVPAPGHDAEGNMIGDVQIIKRPKARKDPNAPKRARGSFVMFTNEMRPKIMKEHPNIKFVDLGVILGQRWRNLNPEDKKHYELLAAQDKERFSVEMEEYNTIKAEAVARTHAEMARTHAEIALTHAEMADNASHYQQAKQEQQQYALDHEELHQEAAARGYSGIETNDQNEIVSNHTYHNLMPAPGTKQDSEYTAHQELIDHQVATHEEPVTQPQQLVEQPPFSMPQNLLEANHEEYYGF